jgi:membrane associated rhomboid family serine protease
MIPLRDHNQTQTTPIITYVLLAINVLVFLFMLGLDEVSLENFITTYALIPAEVVRGQDWFTLISSMFLHGSIGHIVGNMMFLHIFGDNLEDTLGHLKYLGYYLLCGLAASLAQILVDPSSSIPNLGASGAIAGLMGGYLTLFPQHKIDVLLPVSGFMRTATVPAFTMLFYWIAAQFLSGFGQLVVAPDSGGVAYFAHIGGFVAGLILALFMRSFFVIKKNVTVQG